MLQKIRKQGNRHQLSHLKRYSAKDYGLIRDWASMRQENAIDAKYLPKLGLVSQGVAVGFLQQTNTPIAYLEFFMTNPQANAFKRGKALQDIAKGLLEIAKTKNIDIVQMNSKHASLLHLGKTLGFKETLARVHVLRLSKDGKH